MKEDTILTKNVTVSIPRTLFDLIKSYNESHNTRPIKISVVCSKALEEEYRRAMALDSIIKND